MLLLDVHIYMEPTQKQRLQLWLPQKHKNKLTAADCSITLLKEETLCSRGLRLLAVAAAVS